LNRGFSSHDYNPRESLFYETFQKPRFNPSQPGCIALVGGALLIAVRVASAMMGWQSGLVTR
jgi:tryptophan-rich sensory protein